MTHPSHGTYNFGGMRYEPDQQVRDELSAAGIDMYPEKAGSHSMKHGVGKLTEEEIHSFGIIEPSNWGFQRDWYYYRADGPGLPPEYADALYKHHGESCRVDGSCACPDPRTHLKGFSCGHYHVDTPAALKALAMVIRAVLEGIPVDQLKFECIPAEVPEEEVESEEESSTIET